jgi:hypothetical protein
MMPGATSPAYRSGDPCGLLAGLISAHPTTPKRQRHTETRDQCIDRRATAGLEGACKQMSDQMKAAMTAYGCTFCSPAITR